MAVNQLDRHIYSHADNATFLCIGWSDKSNAKIRLTFYANPVQKKNIHMPTMQILFVRCSEKKIMPKFSAKIQCDKQLNLNEWLLRLKNIRMPPMWQCNVFLNISLNRQIECENWTKSLC